MKNVFHKAVDQHRVLESVAANTRSKSALVLQNRMPFLVAAYAEYMTKRGNPWLIDGNISDGEFRNTMSSLFGSKMDALKYINELRTQSLGCCCSLCGSLHSHQVDHFLPQVHYPEFSIFLPNLIPICSCNQKKGSRTIGEAFGERFLHPNFDRKIGERAIYVRIRCHDSVPKYTVIIRKPKGVRNSMAFDFHTRTLIPHSALINYVKKYFERFCTRPGNVIAQLRRSNPINKMDLIYMIREEINESCIQHMTKNNWESIALQSLIERRTVEWIWKRLSMPGRKPGDPLVYP